MVTSVLFHPAALGEGLAMAEIVGAVLSIATVTRALEMLLPALSTACPVTICPAPSVATVTGDEQLAIPDVPSLHRKVTDTLLLFHPPSFASGLTLALMLGRSSSTPRMSTAMEPPGIPLTCTSI